ncbi:MAG: hypothetical protein GDA56_20120 [Hormoscilla sp. GM7CHS1pb]|nr:hypothetical protein [Hormoscilla sp. GM7CHS1pb]
MTSTGKPKSSGKPQGSIKFLSYDQPALKDGLYKLEVTHTFQAVSSESQNQVVASFSKHFAVLGPRFSLEPKEIATVFPPDKTTGRYYNILSHIMFTRSILPWERKLNNNDTIPWLALILVTREEINDCQKKNKDLLAVHTDTIEKIFSAPQSDSNLVFPTSIDLEPGESNQDRINYIDVPEPLVDKILPKEDELPLLAHVRQSADANLNGTPNPKYPILICNRLPQPGDENTVFLISLENRSDVYARLKQRNNKLVYRFVTLTSWRFASVEAKESFVELLKDADKWEAKNPGRVLQLPKTENSNVDKFYEKGYVPLNHQTRQGNRMVSWYRSPLLPGETSPATITNDIQSADELVRFFSTYGMFDVSYAAAWELGRLLMLRNKRVALALFNWKRANAQARKTKNPAHLHLSKPTESLPIPDVVSNWFAELELLEHVPFNYLVPDERLLPKDSLRFFTVDINWLQYLLHGAFSIGRVTGGNGLESELFQKIPKPPVLSGFLLRSSVVAGWPHMEIAGYDWKPTGSLSKLPFMVNAPADKRLSLHRTLLAPDMLLCLFAGNLQMVELYLHPETIHFGVTYQGVDSKLGINAPCYYKVRRDETNGNPYTVDFKTPCATDTGTNVTKKWVRVPFRDQTSRTINIKTLADYLKQSLNASEDLSPAKFALEMIEGVPKMRFLKS